MLYTIEMNGVSNFLLLLLLSIFRLLFLLRFIFASRLLLLSLLLLSMLIFSDDDDDDDDVDVVISSSVALISYLSCVCVVWFDDGVSTTVYNNNKTQFAQKAVFSQIFFFSYWHSRQTYTHGDIKTNG